MLSRAAGPVPRSPARAALRADAAPRV